jgi:hypothetical protein
VVALLGGCAGVAAIADPLPPSPGPHWLFVDGDKAACGAVLPTQRFTQGERGQTPTEPAVFLGRDLTMTNVGVSMPLSVWWLSSRTVGVGPFQVVWEERMGPFAKGPFSAPYGSTGVVEWPPATVPAFVATTLRIGGTCVP